jgi:hypothetical protein
LRRVIPTMPFSRVDLATRHRNQLRGLVACGVVG